MRDARILGRNQHIKAEFNTDAGSLELLLDHMTSDVHLAPDEVYDLFSWLYNYHRDMLVFQMLRADIGIGCTAASNERQVFVDQQALMERQQEDQGQKNSTTCFLCLQEQRITCELCRKKLCSTHRHEVNGYFSLRRYIMCDTCVQHYQTFVGSNRL